jgi:hypothetical protein
MCTGSIGAQPMLERLGMPVMSQKVAMKKAPMDSFNQAPHKARLSIVLWNTCVCLSRVWIVQNCSLDLIIDTFIGTRYATFTLSDMTYQGISLEELRPQALRMDCLKWVCRKSFDEELWARHSGSPAKNGFLHQCAACRYQFHNS